MPCSACYWFACVVIIVVEQGPGLIMEQLEPDVQAVKCMLVQQPLYAMHLGFL
jgi:hypothetical protein